MSFFEKHKIITSKQFGFLKRHSTEHAILDLKEFITENLSSRKISAVLFLDLKKAFDTVSHEILLEKLKHYGVRGLAHDLLSSYLSDRKQYVAIEGTKSEMEVMRWGVPQGSVLGPILFLLFINDLPNSNDINSWLFADDTALGAVSESFSGLQALCNTQINKVQNWLLANKLSVHYETKTQYILFIPPGKEGDKPENFEIQMGGNTIEQTETYKYLGVIIDEKLSWKPHIDKMCSKLASVCGILSKIRHILDRNSLLMIYNSLIDSRLRYGILGWSTASKHQIHRLEVLQNRALRLIDFSPIGTTILPIYSQFNILPLNYLIELERANYMYSFSRGLLPIVFRSYCTQPQHRYPTRYSKTNYVQVRFKSKFDKTSMKTIGPKIWSDISPDMKALPFRKTFSKHLKKLYISRLPTVKRTKKIVFEKDEINQLDLHEIFFGSDNDSTFYGFESELELSKD